MFLLIQAIERGMSASKPSFNTSHVSINLWNAALMQCHTRVSIHLMFLLIIVTGVAPMLQISFNTSHVSINPPQIFFLFDTYCVSIHLMFLLIVGAVIKGMGAHLFQYISCFY